MIFHPCVWLVHVAQPWRMRESTQCGHMVHSQGYYSTHQDDVLWRAVARGDRRQCAPEVDRSVVTVAPVEHVHAWLVFWRDHTRICAQISTEIVALAEMRATCASRHALGGTWGV